MFRAVFGRYLRPFVGVAADCSPTTVGTRAAGVCAADWQEIRKNGYGRKHGPAPSPAKESVARMDPVLVIGRQTASRDHTMNMRVIQQVRSPSSLHTKSKLAINRVSPKADLCELHLWNTLILQHSA
jgi:hypothetical protein